jgi:hypothetical protein
MTPPSFRLLADVNAAMLAQEKRNACANSATALTCGFAIHRKLVRYGLVAACDRNVDKLRARFAATPPCGVHDS